jgi:hypothetical protein
MSLLDEPMEFIDLLHGASMTIRVDRFVDGTTVIHPHNVTDRHRRQHMDQRGLTEPPPAGTPISVEVPVLRLFGARVDEPNSRSYFDSTSKTLRADLIARMNGGAALPMIFRLTANGQKPHKRYSVEVL